MNDKQQREKQTQNIKHKKEQHNKSNKQYKTQKRTNKAQT